MDKIPILLLTFEAPLQSCGERSKWDYRDSAYFPTKSQVVGLLGSALGIPTGDAALPRLSEAIRVGARADRAGTLAVDYHTVTGQIRNAEGKLRGKVGVDGTILSYRQYLEDASFLVAITADEALLLQLKEALQDPVWPPFLGRKCCVVTRPLFETLTHEYSSVLDAFTRYPLAPRADKERYTQYQIENEQGNLRRRDALVGTRTFAYRGVEQGVVEVMT